MRQVVRPVLGVLCAVASIAAQASILPPNKLHLQDRLERMANITQEEFDAIINEIVDQYKPLAAAHGAALTTNKLWTNPTVNASANQKEDGRRWIINMYGGLARRSEVTPDGFALVVCHELGHHFAGFAFYDGTDWAASEGQSDYFATQACARKIWGAKAADNAKFREGVNPRVKARCDSAWKTEADQNLCYRAAKGGESLATLLAALGSSTPPRFETPDAKAVRATYVEHPDAQCRLDTYLAGALCTRNFDEAWIPGRKHRNGQTSVEAETQASRTSCMAANGFLEGVRPRCWYGPQLKFSNMVQVNESEVLKEHRGNANGVFEPGESAHLRFSFHNESAKLTSKIRGLLYSRTKGVTVENGLQRFPDIASGQTVSNAAPFVVKADPALACGSKVNLLMRARSNRGFAEFPVSFLLGRIQSTSFEAQQLGKAIPDGDGRGVQSVIDVEQEVKIDKVLVKLDVTHAYPSDLKIALILPDGKKRLIWNRGSSRSGEGIRDTIEVNLPSNSDAKGVWGIKAVDVAHGDAGTLNSWELIGQSAVCDDVPPEQSPGPDQYPGQGPDQGPGRNPDQAPAQDAGQVPAQHP